MEWNYFWQGSQGQINSKGYTSIMETKDISLVKMTTVRSRYLEQLAASRQP
jgi:hypothetical protein